MDLFKKIDEVSSAGKTPALSFDRVSTLEQQQKGYSLENQTASAEGYADRNNLAIIESFTIAESSWKSRKRPEFKKMILTARQYKIKHLIFKCVDRMSRNFHDLALIMDLIDQEGYTIHFYEGGGKKIDQNSTYADKMIIGVEASVAKNWSDKISYEVKLANEYKASKGIAPGPSRPGYYWDKKAKKFEIDTETHEKYCMIFDTFDKNTYSLQTYCDYLNDRGIRTNNGHLWKKNNLHKLLTNIFYTGNFEFNGEVLPGTHEPYFDMNRYKDRIIKLNCNYTTKRGRNFLLKSFVRVDNYSLTGENKKEQFTYYTNRRLKISFREEEILKALDDFVEGIRFNESFAESLKEMTREIIDEKNREFTGNTTSIRIQIDDLQAKKVIIMKEFAEDELDREAVSMVMNEYNGRIRHLKEQLDNLDKDTDSFYMKVADVIDSMREFPITYAKISNHADKVALAKKFMTHLNITKEGMQAHWLHPFKYIFDVLRFKDVPVVRKRPPMHAREDSNL